jgi:hypothetical protein
VVKEAIEVSNWQDFLQRLSEIEPRRQLLFRGHADSRWHLWTTLERRSDSVSVADYFRVIRRVKPQIESITGDRFELPSEPRINELLEGHDRFSRVLSAGEFPGYSYFIHLRRHGFPSPLLDWTRSPYIAAFFAFQRELEGVRKCSIYVWREGSIRTSGVGLPELTRLGPYVPTHRRHVLQQSDYTICPAYIEGESWEFLPHEIMIDSEDERSLWKLDIPSSERAEGIA